MPLYRVVRRVDGSEVTRYAAASVQEAAWPLTDFDHVEFDPEQLTETADPAAWRITRFAFMSRFTDAEAIGIDLASQGATVPAASMRRYMQKVNAATYIDLKRNDTRAGVQALEAAGLLAAGRAAEILDTVTTEEEIYRG